MYEMGTLGIIHLISAIAAMIFGAIVLFLKKGTPLHIRLGYFYAVSMLILNGTALMIYDLFGYFGPFHFAAIISLISLLGGLVPVYLKKPKNSWLELHYEFMNWSIIGLYAAFWSETFSRFFRFAGFWVLVATGTAMTISIGAYVLKSKKRTILDRYSG
ncbi:MAG: DUF2306 domain-containing protein [Balneola sp.]|nr:MAG: DUF2306 domain-containing protein [Balneola sp.]